MSIKNDIRNDIKAAKKIWLPWWAVLCLIIFTVPVAWLFDTWGRLDLTLPVLNGIAVLGFVIAVKWRARAQAWFWIAMALIAAILGYLILIIPWTTKWVPAAAIAGFSSLGFCAILAILSVVEKFTGQKGRR